MLRMEGKKIPPTAWKRANPKRNQLQVMLRKRTFMESSTADEEFERLRKIKWASANRFITRQ